MNLSFTITVQEEPDLNEFEESLPYKQGTKVVALDEENDPIYEDVGLTPTFHRLKEEKLQEIQQAQVG